MPIRDAEPELHPADLFEEPTWDPRRFEKDQHASGPRWWCLHTKPRQEKATARFLNAQEIAYYLPQVVRRSQTPGGRWIKSRVPLFPGYVFIHGDASARLRSFQGHTLVQILDIADQATLDHDLRQIRRVLATGRDLLPEPCYPVGSRVRIASGSLQGLTGVVVRHQGRSRFLIVVQFLRQSVSIELENWQIEKIDNQD